MGPFCSHQFTYPQFWNGNRRVLVTLFSGGIMNKSGMGVMLVVFCERQWSKYAKQGMAVCISEEWTGVLWNRRDSVARHQCQGVRYFASPPHPCACIVWPPQAVAKSLPLTSLTNSIPPFSHPVIFFNFSGEHVRGSLLDKVTSIFCCCFVILQIIHQEMWSEVVHCKGFPNSLWRRLAQELGILHSSSPPPFPGPSDPPDQHP